MKKLKYVKLFESFLNEELSPETQKRTWDAMVKIAQDPSALDQKIKSQQASNIEKMLAPSVKSSFERLQSILSKYGRYKQLPNDKLPGIAMSGLADINSSDLIVRLEDNGLSEGIVSINIGIRARFGFPYEIFKVLVSKDRYEQCGEIYSEKKDGKIYKGDATLKDWNPTNIYENLTKDRAFIRSLKDLIVEIQKNEIPGDLEVPSEPESVTPEGTI